MNRIRYRTGRRADDRQRVRQRFGQSWAYDPNMLAGFPVGLFFDVDNKAHGLFTYVLTRLGMKQAHAYTLFTLISCLLAPLSVVGAARLLRMSRGDQVTALVLGIVGGTVYMLATAAGRAKSPRTDPTRGESPDVPPAPARGDGA